MSFLKPNTEANFYKWEILIFLWIAFFLNQADRQIFNVLLTSIQSDMHLTDVQMGLIATVFNFAFAALVPISGLLGDRMSKRNILVFSILLWSVATSMTGLSTTIWMFIVFRSLATGMGEASFGPAYISTLADYHKETRALAMSIHQTSYYLGVIVSSIIATYIGGLFGWRIAFVIFGAAGVLHGLLMWIRMRDKKHQKIIKEEVGKVYKKAEKIKLWDSVKIIFCVPTAVILMISFSGLIFVLTGYLTWMPTYLEKGIGMTKEAAAFNATFYTHIAAFIGVVIAGRMSDIVARRNPANRILMQSAGLLLAAPFIVLMGTSSTSWLIFTGLAGFGFLRAFFDANTYPVLYDVIPEKYRSSASGIMMMSGFGFGSLAAIILGALKPILGLSLGISLLAAVWVPCSILLFIAYKFTYKRDFLKREAVDAAS
jgi:hypothetical protein